MNSTFANLSGCSFPWKSKAASYKIGVTFVCCLFFIASFAGNFLIGIIVYRTPRLRKPINYLIVNMATSDVFFPLIVIPWRLTDLYLDDLWFIRGALGNALCKLVPFIVNSSFLVSVQSLVLIAVDRFGAVVFPLRPTFISSKLCPVFILATWIVAMAVTSPMLFVLSVKNEQGAVCDLYWNENFGESSSFKDYVVAFFVVFVFVPITLLVILYSLILVKLRSEKILGEQTVIAHKQRARRNRKVLKMAIAICLVFMLCWLPMSIVNLSLNQTTRGKIPCGLFIYWDIAWFFCASYPAVNPLTCFLFSENYREGLKRLLKCSYITSQNEPIGSGFTLAVSETRTC